MTELRSLASLLTLLFCSTVSAHLSLLQDRVGLSCQSKVGLSVELERRDRILSLRSKKGQVQFNSLSFLDFAVLMKIDEKSRWNSQSLFKSYDHALFHIFENGEIYLLLAQKSEYRESDCDDTGASKSCKSSAQKNLMWSGEKLSRGKSGGEVTRYGHFPNDGTYFWSMQKRKNSLVLIDYGAKFDVLEGQAISLKCVYNSSNISPQK